MRPQDIKIGSFYRFKAHPDYGFFEAKEVLKPKEKENEKTYSVVKGKHTTTKNDYFGFVRYFRPCDLIDL